MAHIAIDFDGTIVTHEFPRIGRLLPGAKETINTLHENGHNIFLWTMRGYHPKAKHCLEDAADFCEHSDINIDKVNTTTSGFKTSSPKQHANLYIDDSALGCPLVEYQTSDGKTTLCADWVKIAKFLCTKNYINKEQYARIINNITEDYELSKIPYQPCD